MLALHANIWDGRLWTIRATEHRIDLEDGTRPVRSMLCRQGPALRAIVKAQIERQVAAVVADPTSSDWAVPVVLVLKKDRNVRFCVDYRKLNNVTRSDGHPFFTWKIVQIRSARRRSSVRWTVR